MPFKQRFSGSKRGHPASLSTPASPSPLRWIADGSPGGWLSAIPRPRALCATQSARVKRGACATGGATASASDPVENVEQYMSDENKMLIVLVVVLVFAMVTYIAFINPPLGIALGVGVAVAMLVWVVLRDQ